MTMRFLAALLLAFLAVPSASALVAPLDDAEAALPVDSLQTSCGWSGEGETEDCAAELLSASCVPEPAGSICAAEVVECASDLCFQDMVCDSPGGYGSSVVGPAPGAVGASIGPPSTDLSRFGPYVGTGVDPQGC